MKNSLLIIVVFFLSGALLTSCNGNKKTVAAAAPQPQTDTVVIHNMKFAPDTLSINKGDTVVFVNQDIVEHNAVALPDSAWMSPHIKMGESWKCTPTTSTDYFCSIHVVMKGRINVNDQTTNK